MDIIVYIFQDFLVQPMYELECSWDSTLHESDWLNKITKSSDVIEIQIQIELQLESYFKHLEFEVKCHLVVRSSSGLGLGSYFTKTEPAMKYSVFGLGIRKNSDLTQFAENRRKLYTEQTQRKIRVSRFVYF